MKVIGLDPSLKNLGLTIVELNDAMNDFEVLDLKLCKTEPGKNKRVRKNSDDLERCISLHTGLSSFINVVWGSDAENAATGSGLPDRTEYDITIDYKPPKGLFQGFWLRARANYIDIDGDGQDVRDYRLTLNYEIPFL